MSFCVSLCSCVCVRVGVMGVMGVGGGGRTPGPRPAPLAWLTALAPAHVFGRRRGAAGWAVGQAGGTTVVMAAARAAGGAGVPGCRV